MSLSIMPTSSNTSQIEELIRKYIELESRPMRQYEKAKDELALRQAMFRDLNSSLLALKGVVDELKVTGEGSIFRRIAATSSKPEVLSATVSGSPLKATYSLFVERMATADVIVSNQFTSFGTDISTASTGDKVFTITVAGVSTNVTVTVAPGETNATVLSNMANAINASGANVTAAVVSEVAGTSRLVITSKLTGEANAITLSESGTGNDLLLNTGTSSSVQASGASGGYLKPRQELDAKFTVNGLSFTRPTNTVTDAIDGLTIVIKAQQAAGDAPVTLEVKEDIDSLKNKIKDFINKYNSTVRYLREKIKVDPDSGTRGPLAGDTTYSNLVRQLRNTVQERVGSVPAGEPARLYDLGITEDREGFLSISDEAKLNNALTDHLSSVESLFGAADGVATRLSNEVSPFVEGLTGIIARQQNSISDQIASIDRRIDSFKERLALREQALRREFSQILRAISLLNAQRSMLQSISSQFGMTWYG